MLWIVWHSMVRHIGRKYAESTRKCHHGHVYIPLTYIIYLAPPPSSVYFGSSYRHHTNIHIWNQYIYSTTCPKRPPIVGEYLVSQGRWALMQMAVRWFLQWLFARFVMVYTALRFSHSIRSDFVQGKLSRCLVVMSGCLAWVLIEFSRINKKINFWILNFHLQ